VNRAPYAPFRPFERETGVLARTDEEGAELRLHRDAAGRYHVHRWHRDAASPDGWRAPVCFGFTPEDLVAMGAAAMALPVAFETPLARAAGGAQEPK